MTSGDVAQTPARRWRWESLTGGSSLLEEDGFRRLWLGRLCSHTALNAVLFTLLVLAVGEGTGQSVKSALFVSAYLLPTATLGTVSGVLVDRLPKNVVLTVLNVVRAALVLFLIVSSTSLFNVYMVALLIAVTSQFSTPAEAASLPHVVQPSQFTTANSTNNFGGLVSQIVGFAVLPPLFLNTIGPQAIFAVAAGLFALAGVLFLGIHALGARSVKLDDIVDAVQDVRKHFAEAWETLSRDMSAYMSVIVVVLASTASLVAVTLMPKFTHDMLDIPVRNSIFVFLPAAVGVLAGLRLVHLLERRVQRVWLVGSGAVLLAIAFLCLSMTVGFADALEQLNPLAIFNPGPFGETSARIVVTVVFSTAAAFAYSVVGVSSRSLVNERMPVGIQGRIFAAQHVLTNLASIPPILLAGLLSELAGVGPVLFLTVIILVRAGGWAMAKAYSRPRPAAEAAS